MFWGLWGWGCEGERCAWRAWEVGTSRPHQPCTRAYVRVGLEAAEPVRFCKCRSWLASTSAVVCMLQHRT